MADAGETAGYMVVFTGSFPGREPGEYLYLRADEGEAELLRGKPPAGRMEREVEFSALPEVVRRRALAEYRKLWDL